MLRTILTGKIRDFGLVAILFVATSNLSHPAAGQGQAPTLDRSPTRSVGDSFTFKWVDQNVVHTYIGQKDGLNCFLDKASNGQQSESCFTSEDNLVRRVGTWEPRVTTPHDGRLSFPLFVGKQWEVSYEVAGADPRYRMRRITARVVSYEKVIVPAGTFDAFKILARDVAYGAHHGFQITEYYSPMLGRIKYDQISEDGDLRNIPSELISYSPAKPGA
jgi:hypothetical protein